MRSRNAALQCLLIEEAARCDRVVVAVFLGFCPPGSRLSDETDAVAVRASCSTVCWARAARAKGCCLSLGGAPPIASRRSKGVPSRQRQTAGRPPPGLISKRTLGDGPLHTRCRSRSHAGLCRPTERETTAPSHALPSPNKRLSKKPAQQGRLFGCSTYCGRAEAQRHGDNNPAAEAASSIQRHCSAAFLERNHLLF